MIIKTWESLPTDEQRTLLKNLPPSTLSRACCVTEVGGIGQRFQPKEHQVLILG